jgi:hypothetical protein
LAKKKPVALSGSLASGDPVSLQVLFKVIYMLCFVKDYKYRLAKRDTQLNI